MSKRNPIIYQDEDGGSVTLRDLFALASLVGMAGGKSMVPEDNAKWAYNDAEAMLEERLKR